MRDEGACARQGGALDDGPEAGGEARGVMPVALGGVAQHLTGEGRVEGEHGSDHRGPEEGRVGAADRVAVHVGPGTGVERIEESLVVHGADHADAPIAARHLSYAPDVVTAVGAVAHDHEGQAPRHLAVGAGDDIDLVFGLESGHHQQVAPVGKPLCRKGFGIGCCLHGTVGNELRLDPVGGPDVIADHAGVGDHGIGAAHGRALGPGEVAGTSAAPLAPLRLQPVDVDGHRDARATQQRNDRGICRIEDKSRIRSSRDDGMGARQCRVAQCLERAGADCREIDQAHSPMGGLPLTRIATVDDDLMPIGSQPRADLLHRGLEAAVSRGSAAAADHRDAHQHAPSPVRMTLMVRSSRTTSSSGDQRST